MARMGNLDSQYEKDDRKPPCFHHDTICRHSCRCLYRLYIRSYIYYLLHYIYIYIIHTISICKYILYISSDPPRYVYIIIYHHFRSGLERGKILSDQLTGNRSILWGYRNQLPSGYSHGKSAFLIGKPL